MNFIIKSFDFFLEISFVCRHGLLKKKSIVYSFAKDSILKLRKEPIIILRAYGNVVCKKEQNKNNLIQNTISRQFQTCVHSV